MVALTAKISYSEKVQSRLSKGKRTRVRSEESAHQLPESPASGATQDVPIPPGSSYANMCEVLSLGQFITVSMPVVFTGGWPCRHPLPSTHPNARPPAGQQVLSISRIVCTDSLSTVCYSSQLGSSADILEICFPR